MSYNHALREYLDRAGTPAYELDVSFGEQPGATDADAFLPPGDPNDEDDENDEIFEKDEG